MADTLSPKERSARMGRVRSAGNRSTEKKVEAALKGAGITGWKKHPKAIAGCPDFYFPKARLAVFVDGCFWHACPKCRRRLPSNNADYWIPKIDSNRRRDNLIRRQLRKQGFHVMRIWEHDLREKSWLLRLARAVHKHGGG
jgi:DNA mismatch endonuclease (patch repair protein)